MTLQEIEDYREFCKLAEDAQSTGIQAEFIIFIRYCVDRLGKGEPVQAIWNEYFEKVP